jgi:hypothetical protein
LPISWQWGFTSNKVKVKKTPFVFFFFVLVEVVGVFYSHGFLEHYNYGIPLLLLQQGTHHPSRSLSFLLKLLFVVTTQ